MQSKSSVRSRLGIAIERVSDEAATQAANWDNIETSKDPLLLYKRILETHRTANTGFRLQDRRKARNEYHRLRQSPVETIADFKPWFDHALDVLNACGNKAYPDKYIAAAFICKLDNAHYGTQKTTLGSYPKKLVEAFTVSSKYKVVQVKHIIILCSFC